MSRKEVPRAGLLKAALAGTITNDEGAGALHLSVRQFIRVKHRFQADGAPGLCHRLRGRPSPRRLPADVRERVATLLQTTYVDVNDCHATEKLREVEGLRGQPRLRPADPPEPRPAGQASPPPPPAPRPPDPRGPHGRPRPARRQPPCLARRPGPHPDPPRRDRRRHRHASSPCTSGRPRTCTATPPCSSRSARAYGLPLTLYGDRFGVFVRNDPHWTLEEELQGHQHPTHFGADPPRPRASASSPPAPRRPRAASSASGAPCKIASSSSSACTGSRPVAAANAFLPEFLADYNRRFAHPPADAHAAWRPRAARLRRPAQLPLHPHRRPRQHRPPRGPLGPDPSGPPRPLVRGRPRRPPRVRRRPAPGLPRRRAARQPALARRPTSSSRPAASPTPSARVASAPPGAHRSRGAAIWVFPRIRLRAPRTRRPTPHRPVGPHPLAPASRAPPSRNRRPPHPHRGDILTEQLG